MERVRCLSFAPSFWVVCCLLLLWDLVDNGYTGSVLIWRGGGEGTAFCVYLYAARMTVFVEGEKLVSCLDAFVRRDDIVRGGGMVYVYHSGDTQQYTRSPTPTPRGEYENPR